MANNYTHTAPTAPPQPAPKKRWGLRIFLGILAVLLLGFFSFLVIGFRMMRNLGGGADPAEQANFRKADTLYIKLSGPMRDDAPPPLSQIFGGGWITPHQIITAIHKAETDAKIKQVIVEVTFPAQLGWGRAEEIRQALLAFKKSKKPLIGFSEFADMQGYFMLSACDKINMPAGGDLLVNGFLAQFPLYKGTLAKIGVQPEFIHHGDFKSYTEAYMNDETSPQNKAQIGDMLDGLYGYYVDQVAASRKMTPDAVKLQIDHGFFVAPDALKGGLIDKLAYKDEVESDLAHGGELKKVSVRRYLGLADGPQNFTAPTVPHIAVLHASGDIVSGDVQDGPFGGGEMIASDAFIRNLREIGRNDDVKVLVLAINSPGGSALASDVMWRELNKLREQRKMKVVVSMGNVAASGGYYMAMGGDHIFAMPTTITGSIGVFGGKFNIAELYKMVAYKKELFLRGANADIFTEVHPMREDQAALMKQNIDYTYGEFVSRVAQGRKMDKDKVEELAQGKVYTGLKAKELGLVDEMGGIDEAIAWARKAANLSDKSPVVQYPVQKNFFDALFHKDDDKVTEKLPKELQQLIRDERRLEALSREPVLLYEPLQVSGN
jgi:protease-4